MLSIPFEDQMRGFQAKQIIYLLRLDQSQLFPLFFNKKLFFLFIKFKKNFLVGLN